MEDEEKKENKDENEKRDRKVPKPFPSKTILPLFNSLAYFVVSPGESFHSVQEVFCDRPRLTIQGVYFTLCSLFSLCLLGIAR